MSGIGFFKRLLGAAAQEQAEAVRLQAPEGARVLMVDDSPTLLAVLGRQLGQEGYATLRALDGESALDVARAEQPALIFLDIVLPGINGFAVLRTLRHDPLTRDIPIVMISGNQQATEQFYVQRFGADDFLKKPFGRREVQVCIDRLVRTGRLPARVAEAVEVASAMPELPCEELPSGLSGLAV
ncbi:response regulator [Dyella sp. LX-66]|uniref:response regulator n=1 Tax=unclassified Dyella TaxID=2634549 RepID=UPI001BDF9D74|nr:MULTISPECIES: response regulator [unclassified Dyella]MBT2117888.1 response regulator [Dyella sp. LX-1]MBT2140795.1 response regulator [Dyella sp. LX-66]